MPALKLVPVSVITWPASADGAAALAGVPFVAVALIAVSVGVVLAKSAFTFSFSTTPWLVETSRLPAASNTMPDAPMLPGRLQPDREMAQDGAGVGHLHDVAGLIRAEPERSGIRTAGCRIQRETAVAQVERRVEGEARILAAATGSIATMRLPPL